MGAAGIQQPIVSVASLVARMNALEDGAQPGRKPVVWRYRNVVKLLKAGGVHIIGAAGCKKYVSLADLRFAFPSFWQSLIEAEEMADDEPDSLSA